MVEFHSCGYIRDIISDMIDLGVQIVHSQVSCMDIDELASMFRGHICLGADFDRQKMPVCSPEWVGSEVERLSEHLGGPDGGLFIVAEVSGPTPLANIEAYIESIHRLQSEGFR